MYASVQYKSKITQTAVLVGGIFMVAVIHHGQEFLQKIAR